MNKKILIALLGWFIVSCTNEVPKNDENSHLQQLRNGVWKLEEIKTPDKHFLSGFVFNEENQVFHLDSQGHTVPNSHEISYAIAGDTLVIVDYKYEEKVRYERGTDIFIIRDLDNEKLILEVIHPEPTNHLVLKNIK